MDEKLKILLCEDDENLGMLLREYLQAKGYSAELCPDGEAGYKAFLKSKFDICVLDVMMPKKDGFALAQEIRQANAEIPIIFLTDPAPRAWQEEQGEHHLSHRPFHLRHAEAAPHNR